MGKQGRFGKYGEIKRLDRLRQSGMRSLPDKGPKSKPKIWRSGSWNGRCQRGPVRIREAKVGDRGFVARLGGKVFSIYGPYREMLVGWFESGMTVTLIALLDRKPVGFAMIGHTWGDQGMDLACELLAIAVEPEKRRMGVGKRLMDETEKRAAEQGAKRLFLHTAVENIGAQKLFSAKGFRPCDIRRQFYPAGQDALLMSKEIEGVEDPRE